MKTWTYLALPLIVLLLAGVMALYAVAQAPEGVALQPRAEAIRGAQRLLLEDESFRHPAFWSPFLLINNWM